MPNAPIRCPTCGAALLSKKPLDRVRRARCPKCGGVVPLDGSTSPYQTAPGDPREYLVAAPTPTPTTAPGAHPFLDPPASDDEIGRLGPYRVLGVLGRGGMGIVFRAEDPTLRRQVALKVMLPQFAADPAAKARFLREGRAQASVEHDHVAAVYQVGEEHGVPYLAMPLLKGRTLADALEERPVLGIVAAVRIAREVAEGLAAAHGMNLIHRDVKPGNIWLEGKDGRVKLLDFGLARPVQDEAGPDRVAPLTATGEVLGTPAYMSPEQARGQWVDGRTDLFSLGCVLYQLLAGRPPFTGNTVAGVLIAVATETPPPPSEFSSSVPPALDDLVMRLLAKRPADRPPTADAVTDELAALESTLARGGAAPGRRGSATGGHRTGNDPALGHATTRTGLRPVVRSARSAAVVAVVLLAGVAVYLLAFPKRPGTEPETANAPPAATRATEPTSKKSAPPSPAKEPIPRPSEPMSKPPEPMPTPPDKGKEPVVAPPRVDRLAVGKATQPNTLLVTRPDADAKWTRLDPGADAVVSSNDEVLALPGYKAEVKLDSGLTVSLWGNLPELLPARLLESRVRFHAPTAKADGGGFEHDADLTLLAGRVYLTPTKAGERVRVRVRAAGEVYDFVLPERCEVAVELTMAYEPGAAFLRAAGPPPRAEVKVAVVRGSVSVAVPVRGVSHDRIDAPAALTWDSRGGGGRPAGPTPVDKANPYFDKFPLLPSDLERIMPLALFDVTARLADATRVQLLMTELVTRAPVMVQDVGCVIGLYGLAALAATADDLKPVVDVLTDETRGPQRVVAITALAAWLPRAADNTAALGVVLDMKIPAEGVADVVLRLLRGAVNPAVPEPNDLDRLVDQLSHPSVAVRELALWNLITFADPTAARVPGLTTDVGVPTGMAYDRFVRAWRARVEEIKKRPPGKK